MEKYQQSEPTFVDKFHSSIHVDALVAGSEYLESTYELYMNSKVRLATAGFKLRKFATNSEGVHHRSFV